MQPSKSTHGSHSQAQEDFGNTNATGRIANSTVAKIEFKVGEVVWARIRGYPHWPARIQSFPSNKMATVIWFNDYRRTKLYKTQIFKFLVNFDEFSKRFNDTVGLETAAREALISYGNGIQANDMLF